MKTLLLIRHAKSSRAEAGLDDHDRPLDERGRQDAPKMGRRLGQQGLKPDLIVSSSALRARSTASLIAAELAVADRIVEDRRLYASSVDSMLYLIQELDDELGCVAFVGHNPEMTELARHFCTGIPDMPTCAVVQLEFELEAWAGVDGARPVRHGFVIPRKGQD